MMTDFGLVHRFCASVSLLGGVILMLCLLPGCERRDEHQVQGYVEGEFVYVASPRAGSLRTLHVRRGAQVAVGDPLFALEDTPEKAAVAEAVASGRPATWKMPKGSVLEIAS
jgi:HlyD family secretion protein